MVFVAKQILQTLFSPQRLNLVERLNSKKYCSSLASIPQITEKMNYLFSNEQKRQLEDVGRIEKISVDVSAPPENVTLVMNNEISTPSDCCKHISEGLCQQAALALINDKILWDMHRPLPGNCNVKFLTFKDDNPYNLNKVFWRTGSFVLGAVLSKAFKDTVTLHLHSFPPPYFKSGSFIYDVFMNVADWKPSPEELRILTAEFLSFVRENHKIERLRVKKAIAAEIFEDNPFKAAQIPQICAEAEDHSITLYRVGDHIDISVGPMVADTSFFGRCAVTAVHPISPNGLFRFQAVALPKGIMLNSFAFQIVTRRAEKLNEADLPEQPPEPYAEWINNRMPPNNSLTNVPKSIYEQHL
ncbi:hypothetical protein RUM43_000755 [Polyplax serrata]|uniref:TGS domain-containing protein n=1 Tax=Polyplax serrata TaxID=468196 RepID=A0AAN8SCU6_POLSC